MTDYVFVGRRRHLVRLLVYGVLTLGIHGRIVAYRQVKEIDGHRALFIDVRIIKLLLLLPFGGPLAVKFKLRRLLAGTVERDVTHPRVPMRTLAWLAFIPIVPAFYMVVQKHLNVYWRRQQKLEDIKHRRAEVERLSRGKATDEKKAAIKELEAQIERRGQALKDEEDAALAIREAEQERQRAEEELRRLHKGPVARLAAKVKGAIPKRSSSQAKEDAPAHEEEASPGLTSRFRQRFRRAPAGEEDAVEADSEAPDEEPEVEPTSDEEPRPGLASRLKGLLQRGADEEETDDEAKPTRTERRAERKAAREEAKAEEAETPAPPARRRKAGKKKKPKSAS